MHIGARLPYEDETLDAVLQMYAPIGMWIEADQTVQTPELQSGSLSYSPPAPPTAFELAYAQRDAALQSSDWTQLPDVPVSNEQRAVWAAYRQELRDVPSQTGFPEQIIWPVSPSASTGTGIPVTNP